VDEIYINFCDELAGIFDNCREYIYTCSLTVKEKVVDQHSNYKAFKNPGLLDPVMRNTNLSLAQLIQNFQGTFNFATYIADSMKIKPESSDEESIENS